MLRLAVPLLLGILRGHLKLVQLRQHAEVDASASRTPQGSGHGRKSTTRTQLVIPQYRGFCAYLGALREAAHGCVVLSVISKNEKRR